MKRIPRFPTTKSLTATFFKKFFRVNTIATTRRAGWTAIGILIIAMFSPLWSGSTNWRPITPPAEAQTSLTDFYFKGHHLASPAPAVIANDYFGVAGPTAENSTETSGGTAPPGQTTALGMIPISGPNGPARTSSFSDNGGSASSITKVWYRTFIMPLAAGSSLTPSTTFTVALSADESDAAANAFVGAFVYVYDSVSNTNVKTLAGPTYHATELGITDHGRIWTVANSVTGGDYTSDSNDYLAVEIWVDFRAATAHTAYIRWGGNALVQNNITNTTPASKLTVGGTTINTSAPLWFQPASVDHPPTPVGHQTGDTFAGGTWASRRMSTTVSTVSESHGESLTAAAGNWRYNSFVSPPLAAQTIPAGKWVIHLHGRLSSSGAPCRPRFMVYVWKNDNTGIRGTAISVTNGVTGYTTTATTNTGSEDTIAGSSIAVSAGDRLVIDWEMTKISTGVGGTCTAFWGESGTSPNINTEDSAILPPMDYGNTPTPLTFLAENYDQTHFRFDADDDGETHTAWTDNNGTLPEDTTARYGSNTNFRFRVQLATIGGQTTIPQLQLHYRVADPVGLWHDVTNSSAEIQMSASANFTQNTATTRQLTDLTTSGWDFVAGGMVEDSAGVFTPPTMTAWSFTEIEWSLIGITPETYEFKLTNAESNIIRSSPVPLVTIADNNLGITSPTSETFTTTSPGTTTTNTFVGNVVITDGGAGWTVSVVMSAVLTSGANTIPNNFLKIQKDGVVGGGSDNSTIWSDNYTNVTESNAVESLDSTRTVGIRSSGTGGDSTTVRPTIQVNVPGLQPTGLYIGQMRFTVV